MARTFGRCLGCGDALTEPGFRTCSRCAVLLEGMENLLVEPPPPQPAREPGDDRPAFTTVIACARSTPKPRQRTGKWLVWACNRRGRLRDAQAIGRERGFPRDMSQWSAGMVAIVVEALQGPTTPR